MSGQMIIVYVIGVAVGAYLVYRIYRVVVKPAGSVRSIFAETD